MDSRPLTSLSAGASVEHRFVVTVEQMLSFQALSGDDSLIHTDSDFSVRHGFRGPVVYGGILLAHLSRVLGTMVPGRFGISLSWKIAYHKPLYVNEAAVLTATIVHISEATNTVSLSFTITREGETLATGKTESLLLE